MPPANSKAEGNSKAEKTAVPARKNLRVLFTQLGSWPKGFVLSPDDLPADASVKRLLDIGAVEEVEPAVADRSGDPPLGPDTMGLPNVAQPGDAKPAETEAPASDKPASDKPVSDKAAADKPAAK